MILSEPNQALRRTVVLSTAILSGIGLIIIGVGVYRPRLIGPIFTRILATGGGNNPRTVAFLF